MMASMDQNMINFSLNPFTRINEKRAVIRVLLPNRYGLNYIFFCLTNFCQLSFVHTSYFFAITAVRPLRSYFVGSISYVSDHSAKSTQHPTQSVDV